MYRRFLSLRYLRARKTNWIGVAGIFVAVTALILILSIMSGFLHESRGHLRGNLADVMIAPRMEFPLASTGQYPEADPAVALERVRAHPRVAAACAQLTWVGMLLRDNGARRAQNPMSGDLALVSLVGIDVADEFTTSDLRANLHPPEEPDPYHHFDPVADVDDPFATPPGYEPDGAPKPAVVLGAQLAAAWGLFRGDEVEIVTATFDEYGDISETPINRTFVVAGTFRTGHNEMDLERVYMEREVLADMLARRAPWSQLLVRLEDYERDKVQVVRDLRAELAAAGYVHSPEERPAFQEIQTWEQFRGNMLGAIENEKTLMGVMLSLVMLVAGFSVFAILTMLVQEKRRDIGILAALGATPRGVLALFLLIGCWQALFGATLGVLAGVWMALRIDPIERWLTGVTGWQIFNRDVYLFDHIPSKIEVAGVAWIVAGGIIATLVAAAVPAYRAARLDPIDALRYE